MAGHGRNAVERVSIADPDDQTPSARRAARQITVWRGMCKLRKARAAGCGDIIDEHLIRWSPRALEPMGNIPPAEAEARYYAQANEHSMAT